MFVVVCACVRVCLCVYVCLPVYFTSTHLYYVGFREQEKKKRKRKKRRKRGGAFMFGFSRIAPLPLNDRVVRLLFKWCCLTALGLLYTRFLSSPFIPSILSQEELWNILAETHRKGRIIE